MCVHCEKKEERQKKGNGDGSAALHCSTEHRNTETHTERQAHIDNSTKQLKCIGRVTTTTTAAGIRYLKSTWVRLYCFFSKHSHEELLRCQRRGGRQADSRHWAVHQQQRQQLHRRSFAHALAAADCQWHPKWHQCVCICTTLCVYALIKWTINLSSQLYQFPIAALLLLLAIITIQLSW